MPIGKYTHPNLCTFDHFVIDKSTTATESLKASAWDKQARASIVTHHQHIHPRFCHPRTKSKLKCGFNALVRFGRVLILGKQAATRCLVV